MKSQLLHAIFSILTLSLITACSNNEDVAHHNSHQDDVALPHTENIEAVTETKSSENETTQIIRSADSHTHGDAALALVLENGGITIELESPLFNILGFEHAPNTEIQVAHVKRAEAQLGRGGSLFTFNPKANCQITYETQEVSLFKTDEAHRDDHEHLTHKDVLLRYQFLCQNPSALSNVSVNLFDFFDELTEISVTYLGPNSQKQVTLSRNQTQMDISQ